MFSKMIRKTIAAGPAVLTVVFASAALLSQPTPAARSSPAGLEFPVIMQQKVAAGETPVGTKVQAKLAVATLVNGVVVPQDAILSGEVTESAAKSATGPSRLAIRMDSARWNNGSAPIKVYLTAWYYPVATPTNQDLSSGLPDAANNPRLRAGGAFPGARNPASPFPGSDAGVGKDTLPAPPKPASSISQHRVLMKNVESTRNSDGAVTLTSKHSNIKLDRQTTYVLAAGGLASGPG
ncbi:MAG TPA: hypothetical protein VE957_09595 [Terriglobales bacterium]|nr:hypothetical protein [Terriglobales bacterium]